MSLLFTRILKKLNSVGVKAAYSGKWEKTPFLPEMIDVEPINICNFRCQHCQVTHWQKPKAQLDTRAFDRILAQFPFSRHIKLQGMGEPFLNKQIVTLLAKGEASGFKMTVISNGSIFNENILKQLAKLKNTTIKLSIDGARAETFEKKCAQAVNSIASNKISKG